jgi:tRNA pseudouridine55 synthase
VSKPRRPPRDRVDGVLLLDKPAGMSSNAALQTARRLFNAAKGGHTGTLDPLATGLLPLCFGEATKFAGELLHADKSYRATLRLGVATDSGDAAGQVVETRPVQVSVGQLQTALAGFAGEIEQVPPMHSALKRDGRPLYEYARAGVEVARQARRVTIHRIDLLAFSGAEAEIDVDCSKGTYIRTLAADIGERLGCGAHLSALRRTRVGQLDVADAVTLTQLEALSANERFARLAPADALLTALPVVALDEIETEHIRHGRGIRWHDEPGRRCRLVASSGDFLGLAQVSADGWLNPLRLVALPQRSDNV